MSDISIVYLGKINFEETEKNQKIVFIKPTVFNIYGCYIAKISLINFIKKKLF